LEQRTNMAFSDVTKAIEQTMKEARKQAQEAFLAELKDVFVRHSELKVIKWTQYTPGFNDGDPCYFTIGETVASNYEAINHYGEWDEDEAEMEEPADLIAFSLDYNVPKKFSDLNDIGKFINSTTGKDILEFMFGDNVTVVVTAAGVDTEDYDCGY
jgi:hypothetical protein